MLAYIKDWLSIQECEHSLWQSTCNSLKNFFVFSWAMKIKNSRTSEKQRHLQIYVTPVRQEYKELSLSHLYAFLCT